MTWGGDGRFVRGGRREGRRGAWRGAWRAAADGVAEGGGGRRTAGGVDGTASLRHCEERSDAAIQCAATQEPPPRTPAPPSPRHCEERKRRGNPGAYRALDCFVPRNDGGGGGCFVRGGGRARWGVKKRGRLAAAPFLLLQY
jgi:hypothetical protein